MKNVVRLSILFIVCALFLIFSATLISNDIVYADESRVFTISTENGTNWVLKDGETIIKESSGSWFSPQMVSSIFSSEIETALGGEEDYTINFVLPNDLTCKLVNSDGGDEGVVSENQYTENYDSNIFIKVTGENYIKGGIYTYLEYKKVGEEEYSGYIQENSKKIRFGQKIDVGIYEVRAYTYEEFIFMNKKYSIKRTSSNTLNCTITKNDNPPIDKILETKTIVIYGKSLSEMASLLGTKKGTYKVAKSLIDENPNIESFIPSASSERQKFKFDYIPNNNNYNELKDVEVEFLINKKDIEVFIYNIQQKVDEPVLDLSSADISYYVKTSLENNDKEEDLGLSFCYVTKLTQEEIEIDSSIPGEYYIQVKFTNLNYNPVSVNAKRIVYSGGRYFVFPTGVNYSLDDFDIEINNVNGFELVVPKMIDFNDLPEVKKQSFKVNYDEVQKRIRKVYVLGFQEQDNYTIQQYSTYFSVTITPKDNTKYLIYGFNGGFKEIDLIGPTILEYDSGEADQYIYLVILEDNVYYESGYNWQHTVLIVFCVLMFCALLVIVKIYRKRRWYLL